MAKRPLKVFRTSIGFADAYIAAPSQKAALEAWGAGRNLFASGMAEVVTDPELAKPALAAPGTVVRVAKGTTADHLAAVQAGDDHRGRNRRRDDEALDAPNNPQSVKAASEKARPTKPKPRPSRQKLDDAHAALDRRRMEWEARRADVDAQIAVLRAERARIKSDSDADIGTLIERIEREEKAYRQALSRWQG